MTKRWRWFWRAMFGMIAGLLLLALLLVAVAARWRHISVGPMTTRLTTPLASDGLPDYIAAINQQGAAGVTESNNAASAVFAVIGVEEKPTLWGAAEARLLNVPEPESGLQGAGQWVSFSEWLKERGGAATAESWEEDQQVRDAAGELWRRPGRPELAEYLDSQKQALDALGAAVQRERFYIPMLTEDGSGTTTSRPSLLSARIGNPSRLRNAGDALLARAILRLGEGDQAGYLTDLTAALRLSRLMAQQPSIMEYLVARAADVDVLRTIDAAAASRNLDAANAGKLRTLTDAAPWPSPVHVLDGCERYLILDLLEAISQGSTMAASGIPLAGKSLVPVHYDEALAEVNGFFDSYRAAFEIADFPQRQRRVEAVEAAIVTAGSTSGAANFFYPHRALAASLTPGWTSLSVLLADRDAEQALARAALQLRIFQGTHGAFPGMLADSGLSSQEQIDPFTDHPLIYRRDGRGYVLYSVGENLKDDGGKARPPGITSGSMASRPWDLVVRAAE